MKKIIEANWAMMARVSVMALCALLLVTAAVADNKDKLAELKFSILKEDNGKPVRNASVILHPVNKDGKQESSGLQLKTDAEGNAQYAGVPYGKLRIQVIAHGFQTYGEDVDINQPTHEIVIKLKRPQKQYSIYDK